MSLSEMIWPLRAHCCYCGTFCYIFHTVRLCKNCVQLVSKDGQFSSPLGYSLFRYTGILRHLILQAKIHKQVACLLSLRRLFLLKVRSLVKTGDLRFAVVASPSQSLYSRKHNKLNLAAVLADDLARCYSVRHLVCARESKVAAKKQSFTKNRQYLASLNYDDEHGKIPVLIVDDVINSGKTISSTAKCLPYASCRYLTLAAAVPLEVKTQVNVIDAMT